MIHDFINYISALDFQSLIVVVKALYHDLLQLVDALKGSSTATITSGS